MLALATATIANLREEGPECPNCGCATEVIGHLELSSGYFKYFICRICRFFGDTRPKLKAK